MDSDCYDENTAICHMYDNDYAPFHTRGPRKQNPITAFKDYCKGDSMTIEDREINVSISRTINLGNYNSLKVTAGMGGSIADDADHATEYKNLWNTVNTEINRAISAFDREKK